MMGDAGDQTEENKVLYEPRSPRMKVVLYYPIALLADLHILLAPEKGRIPQ